MKKIHCMVVQLILMIWFFLDMIGVSFGDKCLVTRSYKDDGIFFLIYTFAVILFIVKEKTGKWFATVWLAMWFVTQFISHEWYTIFQGGFMGTVESKFKNFSHTIQWLEIEGRYIPDVYHTILHVLILSAFVCTLIYTLKNKESQQRSV